MSARLGGEGGRQFYDTWVTLARKARKPGEMRLRMLWRRRPQKPASDARYTIHTTLPEYQASSIRPAFFTKDMIDWRFPGYDRRLQLYMFLDLQHLCIPPTILPRHCSRASGSFRVNSNQKMESHGPDCVDYDTRRQVDDTKHHINMHLPMLSPALPPHNTPTSLKVRTRLIRLSQLARAYMYL